MLATLEVAKSRLVFSILLILSSVVVHDHLSVRAIDYPEDFVNLLAGTFKDDTAYSTGNTLPLIGRPWGFNHWAPQTRGTGSNTGPWWFNGQSTCSNRIGCLPLTLQQSILP
jgi:putative alpha-1,2-mannosidase